MIKTSPFLMHGELVDVSSSRRDGLLADPRHAVLPDRNLQAVPVHGGGLRQMVFKNHPNAVALLDLDGRSRAASVVAPDVNGLEGRDLALHQFGGELENL